MVALGLLLVIVKGEQRHEQDQSRQQPVATSYILNALVKHAPKIIDMLTKFKDGEQRRLIKPTMKWSPLTLDFVDRSDAEHASDADNQHIVGSVRWLIETIYLISNEMELSLDVVRCKTLLRMLQIFESDEVRNQSTKWRQEVVWQLTQVLRNVSKKTVFTSKMLQDCLLLLSSADSMMAYSCEIARATCHQLNFQSTRKFFTCHSNNFIVTVLGLISRTPTRIELLDTCFKLLLAVLDAFRNQQDAEKFFMAQEEVFMQRNSLGWIVLCSRVVEVFSGSRMGSFEWLVGPLPVLSDASVANISLSNWFGSTMESSEQRTTPTETTKKNLLVVFESHVFALKVVVDLLGFFTDEQDDNEELLLLAAQALTTENRSVGVTTSVTGSALDALIQAFASSYFQLRSTTWSILDASVVEDTLLVLARGLSRLMRLHHSRHSRSVIEFMCKNYMYPIFDERNREVLLCLVRIYRACCCNPDAYRVIRFGNTSLWGSASATPVLHREDQPYFFLLGRTFASITTEEWKLKLEVALFLEQQFLTARRFQHFQHSVAPDRPQPIQESLNYQTKDCYAEDFADGCNSPDISKAAIDFEAGMLTIEAKPIDNPDEPGRHLLNSLVVLVLDRLHCRSIWKDAYYVPWYRSPCNSGVHSVDA
ncbi:TPA: LOW QUALITY PROTEIN: hypothetical protein N0F65_012818 [Lagenidium giganteum]|uniref:Uncharacterized protein n=1 Tax=Lagenidium giganteum TaxID=4803 RepID=A0AAV2YGR8_9STRA|nr:TPA: LOW QUALITY PROTEIN: hypothetical protein N0F65_012818 [Lagenidium giganteum]